MPKYQDLLFTPSAEDGKMALVGRYLGEDFVESDELFTVPTQTARNIVAGTKVIDFLQGDPTPGEAVTPVELVVDHYPGANLPYVIFPAVGFSFEIARVDFDGMIALRDAGALLSYPDHEEPKFFLARVDDPTNYTALQGKAGRDILAALVEFREIDRGEMKGMFRLQDASGEPIEIGMPTHGRRDWEVTDYTGRCGTCGHMFLGPKRAPSCKPCAKTAEAWAVVPKPLMERLALSGDDTCKEAAAEIRRLQAQIDAMPPRALILDSEPLDPAVVKRHLKGLGFSNDALREMIDADPDDAEVEVRSPHVQMSLADLEASATVWHDIASAPVFGINDPEAESYVVIAEYGEDSGRRIAVQGWFEEDRFMTDHETPLNDLWIPRLWSPIPRGLAGLLGQESFQARVQPWMTACFGEEISCDRQERNHRFLEEALELVQALGCTRSEAHQLVDYVYGRPEGEVDQEIGGVMVTLAALCLAAGEDMHAAGEKELARVWTKVEKIRAKQAAKPKHSPLPDHVPDRGTRLMWQCLSPDWCYRAEAPLFGNIRVERNGTKNLWSVNWSVPGYSASLIEGDWPDAQSAMAAAECHVHVALGGAGRLPHPERKGVYMASKAVAHGPHWQALRAAGFPVISTWIDECQPDATLDWPDLWHRCLSEVARAEVMICYMEPGETLKGAWVEVGAALALGVPVLGVGIDEFSIAKSGKILLCKTLEEAVQTAHGIMDGNAILRDQIEGNDDD